MSGRIMMHLRTYLPWAPADYYECKSLSCSNVCVTYTAQAREQMLREKTSGYNLLAALGGLLHSSNAKMDCNRVSG